MSANCVTESLELKTSADDLVLGKSSQGFATNRVPDINLITDTEENSLASVSLDHDFTSDCDLDGHKGEESLASTGSFCLHLMGASNRYLSTCCMYSQFHAKGNLVTKDV
ncbi:hypothetical protein NPIL_187751 [Nephila pilipes]|uniref:Uncharacterized protein n=1 Tax=Nephila pilipes TaxID=299642 RepID=A0A8X6NDU3_NEPPI|nr:hypothetical protein NPIL_187751 [Nephila pilipes]